MLREIVLDTETTGLDPSAGDRVVEIGCVELSNHIPTDKTFHRYINPEREMPEQAFKVHGLSSDFLSTKPMFADVIEDFLSFISDSTLIIHNSSFDMGFINFELRQLGREPIDNPIIDTVGLARKKYPGASASLDALCKRLEIDNSHRELHGALLDANLLALVYIELIGGRQQNFTLSNKMGLKKGTDHIERNEKPDRMFQVSCNEARDHEKFLESLDNALWLQIERQK